MKTPNRLVSQSFATLARWCVVCVAVLLALQPRDTAAQANRLQTEVEALHRAMVEAFRANPASVSRFYTDDAEIIGGGRRVQGRAEVDAYWASAAGPTDWVLEIRAVGGGPDSPWVRGVSRLSGQGGRTMETEFLGVLARQPDGSLRYRYDVYTMSGARRAVAPAGAE